MKTIYNWLLFRPKINWFIISVYFLFCIFYHEKAQQPFFWLVKLKGQLFLNQLMSGILITCLLGMAYYIMNSLKNHHYQKNIYGYWILTLVLIFIAYETLMPYNSEAVHFPQYALMGFLIAPRFKSLFSIFLVTCFLGYIDEIYQFFARSKIYFDFNDFVLNLLAAAMGVLIIHSITGNRNFNIQAISHQFKNPIYLIYNILFTFALAGIGLGWLAFYAEDDPWLALSNLTRENYELKMWYNTPWGKAWHQVQPLEGVIYILLLPILYLGLDPIEKK